MDYLDLIPDLDNAAQKYFEKIQNEICYCIYCQPYDGGDCIWVFGEEIELDDLFDKYNVPKKYRDSIAQHLSCPNCGREVFERFEKVGLEDPADREIKYLTNRAERKFGRKIDEFQRYLELYPALALNNSLGKKIHKEISQKNLPSWEATGKFFRARLVKGSEVLSGEDMGAPPQGVSEDGRYHHSGQSVLYLSQDQDVAINEALGDATEKALVWVQTFNISIVKNILDLSTPENQIYNLTSPLLVAMISGRILTQRVEDRRNKWRPQYFLTRFISDCARLAGYEGIRYRSASLHGINLVLFNPSKADIGQVDNPKVLIFQSKYKKNILDFDF
jgi:hypothetical protein